MADRQVYLNTQPLLPIQNHAAHAVTKHGSGTDSFADILSAEETKVSFSQHAISRLQERNLSLSEQELSKLDSTVEKMARKGARESLIYMNDIALVVSVTNKKVITAMDGASAKDNIFTNIDSAAII